MKKRLRRVARVAAAGVLLAGAFSAVVVFAYTAFQDDINGAPVVTLWPAGSPTITWNLDTTIGSNVSTSGGLSVQQALTAAFSTWQSTQLTIGGTPTTITSVSINYGQSSSLSNNDPSGTDCQNWIYFSPSPSFVASYLPSGTIAVTTVSSVSGLPPQPTGCSSGQSTLPSQIVDADMTFNPGDQFSTATPTPANFFDLQSIATHEGGHMLGLDHSGIGHAVMFPYGDQGDTSARSLATDDVIGIANLYPASNLSTVTGTVNGTVTLSGSGLFAAQVILVDNNTGSDVVSTLTNLDGSFTVSGVPPSNYQILALPLFDIYTIDNFSGWECGYTTTINTYGYCVPPSNPLNFTGTYF